MFQIPGFKRTLFNVSIIDSRLREITAQFIHPLTPVPSAPTSPHLAPANGHAIHHEDAPVAQVRFGGLDDVAPAHAPVAMRAAAPALATIGSFQFLSASEVDEKFTPDLGQPLNPADDITEQAPSNMTQSTEWVHINEGSRGADESESAAAAEASILQETAVLPVSP